MPKLTVGDLHDRLPAVIITVLFHVAVIAVLLNAIPKYAVRKTSELEAIIALTPQKTTPPRTAHRATAGSTAISPYFYHYNPPPSVQQPDLQGLSLALSACGPENLGNLPPELREQCDRINTVLLAGRDALPNAPHVKNARRWEAELLLKQTPQLLPCASPNGIGVSLGTLLCIADLIQNGYRPETTSHYSK